MSRDTRTDDMFKIPQPDRPAPGSANYATEISLLVADILRECELDRWEIAAQMSRLSGDDVTKNMIDAWASAGRPDHNIPFYRVALFELVTNSHRLADWVIGKRGGEAAYGREVLEGKLGRLTIIRKRADQEIRELQRAMRESGLVTSK